MREIASLSFYFGQSLSVHFTTIDFADPIHAGWLVSLLDAYARDPMGGGQPLDDQVFRDLPAAMAATPGAFSIVGCKNKNPIALANCFTTLSTFACKPIVNVHDLVVMSEFRGQGVGTSLMAAVEQEAVRRGCCKITLEVLSENQLARNAYAKFGFRTYTLSDDTGHALFLQKKLDG